MDPLPDHVCAPGIHMVRIDEDIVILAVIHDRYAALVGAADHLVLGPGGAVRVTDAVQADLIAAGLIREGAPDPARRSAAVARHDLVVPSAGFTPNALRAAAALTASALRFRRLSFAQMIATSPRADAPGPPVSIQDLARVMSAARAAWPWMPLDGACLQRAFQLRALYARHGFAVDWVFGVRTWPFAAHCWLQSGDRVLNDTLDRVGRYTPIMVV